MQAVKEFMQSPEIWRYCAEFGADKESKTYTHGPKETWLAYTVDRKPVGLINMHVMTGSMCQFHPYILRAYKDKYDEMVQEFFAMFAKDMQKEVIKLNAIIATCFKGAIRAAFRAGMHQEGVDRLSFRTKDGTHDRILFGILREEM